jgi:hypothetical protein
MEQTPNAEKMENVPSVAVFPLTTNADDRRRDRIVVIQCLGILDYMVYRSTSLPIQERLSALSQVPVPAKHML